jgi:mRNA interferase MazF
MVNGKLEQGDIIKLNLNPTKGHEQSGFRPVLVISNEKFNSKTNLLMVCPVTNTINGFPLHVRLEQTTTTGEIKCEQMKAIDPHARSYTFIETVPKHILQEAVDIIFGAIEML